MNQNVEETLYHLSSFIQSFSYLANEFQVSKLDPLLRAVEQILDIFFVNFPKIPLSHRRATYMAISGFLATLFKKGPSVLSSFISDVGEFFFRYPAGLKSDVDKNGTFTAYEALVYTCSDTITTPAIAEMLTANEDLPDGEPFFFFYFPVFVVLCPPPMSFSLFIPNSP